MKKIWFTLVICGWAFMANAQMTKTEKPDRVTTVNVEKSIFSIQTGYLGIWINNEARLSNSIVLRSELGFAAQIWGISLEKTGFLLTPQVTLEPRWYYNLKKRKSKSKKIIGNSGNFIALQTSYLPGGRAISNYNNVETRAVITYSLLWGIKRNLGNHFDYEVGVGPGFSHTFPDKAGYGTYNDYGLSLLLRIGYRF